MSSMQDLIIKSALKYTYSLRRSPLKGTPPSENVFIFNGKFILYYTKNVHVFLIIEVSTKNTHFYSENRFMNLFFIAHTNT